MYENPATLWAIAAGILVFGEFVLPGLVSVFVGLGALTTAGALYFGWIHSLPEQIITLCVSSTFYIFSLRLMLLRILPNDTDVANVDEDALTIGQKALVFSAITQDLDGRIEFEGSTWGARSLGGRSIEKGATVSIVGRDNITYIVKEESLKEDI